MSLRHTPILILLHSCEPVFKVFGKLFQILSYVAQGAIGFRRFAVNVWGTPFELHIYVARLTWFILSYLIPPLEYKIS